MLFDLRVLLSRLVGFVEGADDDGEEKRRTRTIPTYREWYDQHREQFERTERHYREWMAREERRIAEERAARGEDVA